MKVNSGTIGLAVLMCLVSVVTTQPDCICFETLAKDLKSPTVLYEPEDGTCRLLIATLEGVIYVYYKDGSREKKPFLDITDRVIAAKLKGELGLVGLATHPNFKNNNRFYVFYTTRTNSKMHFRLSQFQVMPNDTNKADPDSEVVMIEEWKKSNVHHGGQLLFDEEGYLYIFIGDNGPQGDTLNQGQNKATIQATALRLDVTEAATPGNPYAIPHSNPYFGHPDCKEEIYAYGLRNPWSAKMDPGPGKGKGRIFIGDVGWKDYEEVNILEKGGNYGWSLKEGNTCLKKKDCSNITDEVKPIAVYSHKDGNCIIGGAVYRGCLSPNLTGLYLYADFGRGRFWFLKEHPNGSWISTDLAICPSCPKGLNNVLGGWIYNFGQDLEGEVYALSTGERDPTLVAGYLHRIVVPDEYEENKATCAERRCGARPGTTQGPEDTTTTTMTTTTEVCDHDKDFIVSLKRKGQVCKKCTCKELMKNTKKAFRVACKKNLKGIRVACCKLCAKKGYI